MTRIVFALALTACLLSAQPAGRQKRTVTDDEVTRVFDDMLKRSIPQYEAMRHAVANLAMRYVKPNTDILDLGSGSGAIALAIASERPHSTVLGVDISAAAVTLALRNASRLGLGNVTFTASDWFSEVPKKRYDAIVANPPYVASGDAHLSEGDLRFEPPVALAAGADGLSSIRAVVADAAAYMSPGAWLLIEHGYDQAEAVQSMLRAAKFGELQSRRDLAGIPRIAMGRV
jgi:release factor glutamine methyltransferase